MRQIDGLTDFHDHCSSTGRDLQSPLFERRPFPPGFIKGHHAKLLRHPPPPLFLGHFRILGQLGHPLSQRDRHFLIRCICSILIVLHVLSLTRERLGKKSSDKMTGSCIFLAVALTALSVVSAWQPDYILRLSNMTIYSDCQPRQSIVVNG